MLKYLDLGVDQVKQFLDVFLFPEILKLKKDNNYIGPKSKFQEWSQSVRQITPHYKLISSSGPDHAKKFLMAVFLNDEKIAEGLGNSKQEAEQVAAKNALKILKI